MGVGICCYVGWVAATIVALPDKSNTDLARILNEISGLELTITLLFAAHFEHQSPLYPDGFWQQLAIYQGSSALPPG